MSVKWATNTDMTGYIELAGMADFIGMDDSIVKVSHDKVIDEAGSNCGAVMTICNPFSA